MKARFRPSLDWWSVLAALGLAALIRLGLLRTVPW
jgi:hypothetical protein